MEGSEGSGLKRLLIVDDDPGVCTIITLALQKWFTVTTCETAESAIVHANNDPPFDLIISDFMLPGMSGLELRDRFRQIPRVANVPCVMVTAHTNYAMEQRALDAGVSAFLYKPFTLSQLRSVCAKLMTKATA